ncbi:hypothetical protein SDC9_161121 [bioreactor metagenome]|uniref:Uncharacterized protein n=1 Tax=bioreactor metagenome TaxID=1076179 RepID=A0A645FH95_9ZZZZ
MACPGDACRGSHMPGQDAVGRADGAWQAPPFFQPGGMPPVSVVVHEVQPVAHHVCPLPRPHVQIGDRLTDAESAQIEVELATPARVDFIQKRQPVAFGFRLRDSPAGAIFP